MSPDTETSEAFGLSENQRAEVRLTDYSRQLTAGGGKPGQGYGAVFVPAPSTSSAAGSRARISRSPGAVQVSLAFALASSSSSSAWLASYGLAGFCWRTYLDCSAPTGGGTSEPSSAHWETQGTAWGGECWTAVSSESPSGAAGCSLSAVLEPRVPTRFSLSPRACRGILRRAEKRGRALPTALAEALTASAKAPDPGAPTTS